MAHLGFRRFQRRAKLLNQLLEGESHILLDSDQLRYLRECGITNPGNLL